MTLGGFWQILTDASPAVAERRAGAQGRGFNIRRFAAPCAGSRIPFRYAPGLRERGDVVGRGLRSQIFRALAASLAWRKLAMNEDEGTIPITADGLMVLRSDPALTSEAGIEDPFAAWFVTEAGRQLAQIALSIDPVYAIYNLARYRRFGALLARASQEFPQIVMLGAGYDTRAIWMQELREKRPRVFEVDVAATLATKAHVLAAHDVIMPETIVQVPADLNRDDLLAALRSCGFNEAVPSFVMAEGVTFFLDAQTVDKLLSPSMLGLA